MKNLFTISILTVNVFLAFGANAQLVTISASHQMPVIGDSVHYVDANTFGFDPTGVGPVTTKIWDESLLMLTGNTYDFNYVDPTAIPASLGKDSFLTATIARSESGASGYFYYRNTADSINRLGWYINAGNHGIYKNGTVATEFHFPITAGQTFASVYHGNYSPFNAGEDSVRIEYGSLSINADMQGQVILPTGTFNDVLRLHVIESFHIVTYAFNLIITDNLISDDYYYWFSDSVFQPIMVYGITSNNGTPQAPVLRYQPITIPTSLETRDIWISTIYPNPSSGKFYVVNGDFHNPDYELEMYNMLGEKINFATFKRQNSVEVDISDSPKGIYFLKIVHEQLSRVEKIVIR